MKTEEDATDLHAVAEVGSELVEAGPSSRTPAPPKRTVCDHCRRRRIRCDGEFPCRQCLAASLTCRREHVPRKRGPKRGHGRVINELRAKDAKEKSSRESSADIEGHVEPRSATTSNPSTPGPQDISWNKNAEDPRNAPEPQSRFTSDQYQPNTRSYLHLIPQCVDLYYEHIYPIMPLLYMPAIRAMIARPMNHSEKNLMYSVCALTCMHMSGKSLQAAGPPSWEVAGRYFLDECISNRNAYDFMEDQSLFAVISSFWLSTSFFEINQNRKSWLYLRESLTLANELGLQDDSKYVGLSPEETLCRQRVFWILFVTERSFAILRNKPITFKKIPSLPTTRHPYEPPDIHTGFRQLISSYTPLDESFVTAWNDGSDPRVTASTYLALQEVLLIPPPFLSRPRSKGGPSHSPLPIITPGLSSSNTSSGDEMDDTEPTAIQKADLLITQQWLRLIVWQSSFRQGLLSWSAPHESMHFAFPLAIARSTASVLSALPSTAVEVHGMGIFEKIFEIGTWCINVLGACDSASAAGTPLTNLENGSGVMGMDFVSSGDLGLLGLSRKGVTIDPLEFFVKTLSASPNSRTQFAERLLMFAQERPGGLRMSLSPALAASEVDVETEGNWGNTTAVGGDEGAQWGGTGGILGEVKEEYDADTEYGFAMSSAVPSPVAQMPASIRYSQMLDQPNMFPPEQFSTALHTPISADQTGVIQHPQSTWSGNDEISHDTSFQLSPTVERNMSALSFGGGNTPSISRRNTGASTHDSGAFGGDGEEDGQQAPLETYDHQHNGQATQGSMMGTDTMAW